MERSIMKKLVFVFLLLCLTSIIINQAIAGDDIVYSKIKTIEPNEVNGQYCYIKIVMKQKGDTITKEEIMECADGKKGIETPGYWELYAQFYYRDMNVPPYCRVYSRTKHAFKLPGKVCLTSDGKWEVQ
tara:strand:- start:361 stop:747 length:387 start_codon:yes stop_codon:yes gene_type:complete